jgi:hypothetical protein
MTDEIADFLNQDWLLHPQMRYACSRILAGMILLDTMTGKSIVANSIEVYGRTRSLDSHREALCNNNTSSLPPETTKYRNVWPTTLTDSDGVKLVIGTKTFNALVTSSLRLDSKCEPDIGPSTNSFILDSPQQSQDVQLFIKEIAWKAATDLANDTNTNRIYLYDSLSQLRQLRTRFHHHSTYLLCRSSNETTNDLASRPFTIFTLADWDTGRDDSGYRVASKLFQLIAKNMISGRCDLKSDDVRALASKLNHETEYSNHFVSVLALFDGTDGTIPILGNEKLGSIMADAANLLTKKLSLANQSVKKVVTSSFSS